MLSKQEISRYSRHLLLPEIGVEGQNKLKNSKVLVIGAGGLGCPVLLYLTAAGVGIIGIVDFDVVDESNLQRQILYTVTDISKSKAAAAAAILSQQNPYVKFNVYNTRLNTGNALDIFNEYDIIVDGTDNFATRYLINDACVILNKPLVYGAIYRFEGQVTVLNKANKVGTAGPTYRCIFPTPPDAESAPNCSEIGVLGVLPGIIGTLQANETIKIITGIGESLSGKLLLINALTMNFNTVNLERNPENYLNAPGTKEDFAKMNYESFCSSSTINEIKNITASELSSLLNKSDEIQLVDVREINEDPIINDLIDIQIPLADIKNNTHKIAKDKMVVVFCKGGSRSKRAIELLQNDFGFSNLYNLQGGVLEWEREINNNNKVNT